LAKKFFGCTFYKNHIYIFEISIKRRILWYPAIFEEKKISSLRRTMNTFWEIKGQKWKKPLNISKNGFYKEVFDIHSPFKNACFTSKLWNFVKITGP
jgi:hypothetical protein